MIGVTNYRCSAITDGVIVAPISYKGGNIFQVNLLRYVGAYSL